jgi:hypothetical protein
MSIFIKENHDPLSFSIKIEWCSPINTFSNLTLNLEKLLPIQSKI